MSLRVEQSDTFLDDLGEAMDYGLRVFGKQATESFSSHVDEWVSIISEFPEVGARTFAFEGDSRRILVKTYWLYYRLTESTITLLRLIRTEREPN